MTPKERSKVVKLPLSSEIAMITARLSGIVAILGGLLGATTNATAGFAAATFGAVLFVGAALNYELEVIRRLLAYQNRDREDV